MQLTGVLPALAPLATGHPQGLPAPAEGPPPVTRVQPVAEQANIGTETGTDREPPSEARHLQARQKTEHAAPPSAMQIRIAKMLQDQAEKLVSDKAPSSASAKTSPQTTETTTAADPADDVRANDDPALPALTGPDTAPDPQPEQQSAAPQQDSAPLPIPYGSRADLSAANDGGAGVDKTT